MLHRWKPVRGFEGCYWVSDHGVVYSVYSRRRLKHKTYGPGYPRVTLYKERRPTDAYIHRLMMEAFVGPPPEGHEVNHRNGDKTDNRLENLEYVTPSANVRHACEIGLKSNAGEDHSQAVLNWDAVRFIRRWADVIPKAELASAFRVHPMTVHSVITGKSWREETPCS